jgi:hypothetical protein
MIAFSIPGNSNLLFACNELCDNTIMQNEVLGKVLSNLNSRWCLRCSNYWSAPSIRKVTVNSQRSPLTSLNGLHLPVHVHLGVPCGSTLLLFRPASWLLRTLGREWRSLTSRTSKENLEWVLEAYPNFCGNPKFVISWKGENPRGY